MKGKDKVKDYTQSTIHKDKVKDCTQCSIWNISKKCVYMCKML
jgi:hypothetical protein